MSRTYSFAKVAGIGLLALTVCFFGAVASAQSQDVEATSRALDQKRSELFNDYDASRIKSVTDTWLWLDNGNSYCLKRWVVAEYYTVGGVHGFVACADWNRVPAGEQRGPCDSEVKIKKLRFHWLGPLFRPHVSRWWTAPAGHYIYDGRIVWKYCNSYEDDANDYQPLP